MRRFLATRPFFSQNKDQDSRPRRAGERSVVRAAVILAVLTAFAAIVVVPFIYMFLMSMKSSAEAGQRSIFPDALRDFARLGNRRLVWMRAELTDYQLAALNRVGTVPVAAGAPSDFSHSALWELPPSHTYARKLSIEKPRMDAPIFAALFEAQDMRRMLASSKEFTIFYRPSAEVPWQTASAVQTPRTPGMILRRLTANYRSLLGWDAVEVFGIARLFSSGFPRWFLNSLLVALVSVILGIFLDSLAGFAFAKFDFPLRNALFGLLLATLMIPYPVTLVPSFFLYAKLHLYNTYAALIIPGVVSAFGIFLVRQYVRNIPDEMLSAARVDGATDFHLYLHIILPTARPVLAALAVFRFIWQWNSYLFPLVLTNRDSMKNVQLGLATMQDAYGTVDFGLQMAGATLSVVPILVVYAFMQRHFIAGITLGSVKD